MTPENNLNAEQETSEVESSPVKLIGYKQLFLQSLEVSKMKLPLIGAWLLAMIGTALAGLILAAVGFFGAMVAAPLFTEFEILGIICLAVLGVTLYSGWLVAMMVVNVALIYALVHRELAIGYWSSCRWCFKNIWPIFFVSVAVQLVTYGGYGFILIPGIALAIYTLFSLFVFCAGEKRGWEALLRSAHLVSGSWWAVVGRLLFVGLGVGLGVILSVLLLGIAALSNSGFLIVIGAAALIGIIIFGMLWITVATTLLFESLQTIHPLQTFSVATYQTLKTIFKILAIIGLVAAVAWNAVSFSEALTEEGEWGSPSESELYDDENWDDVPDWLFEERLTE